MGSVYYTPGISTKGLNFCLSVSYVLLTHCISLKVLNNTQHSFIFGLKNVSVLETPEDRLFLAKTQIIDLMAESSQLMPLINTGNY